MNELSKKTFITIFSILSLFIIINLFFVNITSYKMEYENVKRNLNFTKLENRNNRFSNFKIDNMLIMDYEVYTIIIDDGSVGAIISHGNQTDDFDVASIATNILNTNHQSTTKIGNLYFSKYSYQYNYNNMLVILNNKSINEKLWTLLLQSVIILMITEIIIFFIAKKITIWITKPALEAFDRQKNFIADASHELKTPLAVIMASSDELSENKKNEKYIENIKYEADRMNKLIASMLDLSKLESGITKNNYKEENISKIINKICLTFEAIAFEHNLQIVPELEENIMFKCSKEEIEKLISIIIDNAIKHSYKDASIQVKLYKDKNNIIIDITNDGDPIKQGEEEKIFERFYRSDKSRNRVDNRYGLGLAIAKNIVTNHHGTITAKSIAGKTTFKIILKK